MQNMIFVLYPLFCILLPCMLYVLIQTKGFHRRTNFIHMIWVFIFLYYVYLVLETTGIGTIWEIGLYPGMKLQEEIKLIPWNQPQYDFKCGNVYAARIFAAPALERISKSGQNCDNRFLFFVWN